MADLFKMADILMKNRPIFHRVQPTLESLFFQKLKCKTVGLRPKIYQKNLPKKIKQDGGSSQDGV